MTTCIEPGCTRELGLLRFHPDDYCIYHAPAEATSQAIRTARRATFRDRWTPPQEDRSAAEHDAAIEAFVRQLAPLRRVPKGQ
jgi:hypothetical protein